MASVIRQLSDDALEAAHHMIRRDAMTDLEIARKVEDLLGRKIAKTNKARAAVVYRYRKSKAYTAWLKRWERQWVELETSVRTQQQRLEVLKDLVKTSTGDGFEELSKQVQGRLLTMAATASDDDLRAAAGAKGWITSTLRIVHDTLENKWRRKCDELKAEITAMLTKPKDGKRASAADVVAKVDKIMGLG